MRDTGNEVGILTVVKKSRNPMQSDSNILSLLSRSPNLILTKFRESNEKRRDSPSPQPVR